jgi:glycosyltransferase involved in cell wall biosynthesis
LTLAYPIARLRRAPIVLVVYGIEAREPRGRPLAKRFTSRVDAVISIRRQTTRTLASWAKLAATQTYLLENAIDLSLYGAAPKDPKLVARFGLAGKRVVMTMSRLGEQYVGIDEVLGALPAIAAESPDIVYLVAGEGPDLPRLRDKARALGVANRVVFAGFVPELRKADYYRLADAYAMPGSGSDFDRYPLRFGFLEAMACGIPVVGAVCEDEEERRADGGLLARQVDPHDSRAIAQGILEALAMPKAIPAGLERFGFPAFERRLHAVVDEIMARARRSSGSSALSLPKAAS